VDEIIHTKNSIMIEIFNWMEKKDHAKIMIDKVIMN
jgi:hypothetical protein